ncbi:MAG: phosphoglycerate dehydrogenase [Deltaproteobacteria bacterium]|nr:phosphoglycerate dehydrogenase [Deltaproteobacteria bacterium]
MKVLIADKVPAWFSRSLEEAGCTVHTDPSLDGPTLTEAMRAHDPTVVVVRSTKVQAEQIDAGNALKMIVRAGAGVNTIDVAKATTRGVKVTNCPGKNSSAVAELTIGFLVALDRRICDNVADLKAGKWAKKEYSKAEGLRGRTLGCLGLGNIGREVAHIAQAMGMNVIYWDPFVPADAAPGCSKMETALEVAAAADAVTIHLALVPATRNLVNEAVIDALKPGAMLVNTSRAEIVDKAALVRAVQTKRIRVGLDVYWTEPAANDTVFADDVAALPGVYGTHHIGASTEQAQDAVAKEAVRIIRTFLDTGEASNCVNP